MKLFALPPSPNTFKVTALAFHLDLPLEIIPVDMPNGQHQSPDYLKMNPNGMMPTLVDGDFSLWESNAILLYLARKKPESGMVPADPKLQAQVDQWLSWSSNHWGQVLRPYLYERMIKPMFRGEQPDPAELAKADEPFHRFATVLENHLKGRQYLVGEAMSVADFAVACSLVFAQPAGFPLGDYPNIQAFAMRITSLPAFQKALPPMVAGARG